MRPKSVHERKQRDEMKYEQLILEIPLHRPAPRPADHKEDERDRGVVVIDLY